MLYDHAKLVQFVQLAQHVHGRKRFQKMIYIAKKCGIPFQEKYELHMYGPYSEELTCRIEELCELGFLDETKRDTGSYVVYEYEATEAGIRFANTLVDKPLISDTLLTELQAKSSRFLELVSTLLYFDECDREEQMTKVKIVKNKLHFTDEEFEEAFHFIDTLPHYVQ